MNPLFLRIAPYVAAVVAVLGVLLASYAKGYSDANAKWEAKHKDELIRMYQSGKAATDKALKGWAEDVEKYRNRRPAPVVRVCNNVSGTSGGTAATPAPGQPGAVGERVEEARDIGTVTADILDEADLNAARCNRLIQWLNDNRRSGW